MAEVATGPSEARKAVRKILLVDDSKTELHVLAESLVQRGFQVRAASNADEAGAPSRLTRCTTRIRVAMTQAPKDNILGMRLKRTSK